MSIDKKRTDLKKDHGKDNSFALKKFSEDKPLACTNCLSTDISHVHKRDNCITYQNVLFSSQEKAQSAPRRQISLYFCNNCSFLFNPFFEPDLAGFSSDYNSNQTHSKFFKHYVSTIANKILIDHSMTNHKILEIGCGSGYFLEELILSNNMNVGFGYDKAAIQKQINERLFLFSRYYKEDDLGGFDAIIARHVVGHILDNANIFLLLKKKNPDASFFIETASLEWIIENQSFYDIFYEQCSYFSEYALYTLFKRTNINVALIQRVFDGKYLWLEALKDSRSRTIEKPLSLSKIKDFFTDTEAVVAYYSDLIAKIASQCQGKIVVWGASGKGITFVNLIDPKGEIIDYLVDSNPLKAGRFVPGTAHPIYSPDTLQQDNVNTVIIMNKNYEKEIKNTLNDREINFLVLK